MQYIVYVLFRLVILLVSFMPFRLLYILSDISFYIFYYLLGYRKKVVLLNLRNSFPEKSEKEIKILAKKYYKYLPDLFFESLKGMSLSKEEISRRHKYINPEVVNHYLNKNQSVIGVSAHYGNWEWGAFSGATQFTGKMVTFYKPINNKIIDDYMVKHRSRFNCQMASISDTFLTFKQFKNKAVIYFMIADQSPSSLRKSFWFNFLNQDTAFIHGPELYAQLFNLPVIFSEIRRVKRGYYEIYFNVLAQDPASLPKGEVTRLYAEKLENVIKQDPAYWLWSHRRWKRSRTDLLNIRRKNVKDS